MPPRRPTDLHLELRRRQPREPRRERLLRAVHAAELSEDDDVNPCTAADRIIVGDARDMQAVESNSVALVVTSPPYFAGKEYEEALGEGHVPATYLEYLEMLRDVFAECGACSSPVDASRSTSPTSGASRTARSPATSSTILQDDLGLLLRGEIVWQKAKGASGRARRLVPSPRRTRCCAT